jgi:hypothetical protein
MARSPPRPIHVPELAVFIGLVMIVTVVAIRLGMLLAPRLDRLTEPHDEDDGGHDD